MAGERVLILAWRACTSADRAADDGGTDEVGVFSEE